MIPTFKKTLIKAPFIMLSEIKHSQNFHSLFRTIIILGHRLKFNLIKTDEQGIASDTIPYLLISLLDGYSFINVHVKGIVAFEH